MELEFGGKLAAISLDDADRLLGRSSVRRATQFYEITNRMQIVRQEMFGTLGVVISQDGPTMPHRE